MLRGALPGSPKPTRTLHGSPVGHSSPDAPPPRVALAGFTASAARSVPVGAGRSGPTKFSRSARSLAVPCGGKRAGCRSGFLWHSAGVVRGGPAGNAIDVSSAGSALVPKPVSRPPRGSRQDDTTAADLRLPSLLSLPLPCPYRCVEEKWHSLLPLRLRCAVRAPYRANRPSIPPRPPRPQRTSLRLSSTRGNS